MPLFEFRCTSCGHKFEELVFSTVAASKNIICPACGRETTEKLISSFSSAGGQNNLSSSGCSTSGFS